MRLSLWCLGGWVFFSVTVGTTSTCASAKQQQPQQQHVAPPLAAAEPQSINKQQVSKQHQERLLFLNPGGSLTPAPQDPDASATPATTTTTATPDPNRVRVSTNYTYYLYTSLDPFQSGQALDQVRANVRSRLEDALDDLQGDGGVTLLRMVDDGLSDPCPTTTGLLPAWAADFTTCSKYRTTIEAEMGRRWNEKIFARTVVQVARTYLDDWNAAQGNSYVHFDGPRQVETLLTLLFVGARQLMTMYEYSLLEDAIELSALSWRARENPDPPFNIIKVRYVWQKIITRDGTMGKIRRQRYLQGGGNGGGGGGSSSTTINNQVQMLVVATCNGDTCTDESMGDFVTTTMPDVTDVLFENLKKWAQTNYFRNGNITSLVLDRADPNATFMDFPELPPESDYQTPGVQDEDPPLWIWFAMLMAAGAVFLAVVYVTFCLTARDFQAARQLRREHREAKKRNQEQELKEQAQDQEDEERNSPRSPAAQRYFNREVPIEDENEFDVSESHISDANISEVPVAPGSAPASPKKKKKKKKKSSNKTKKAKKNHETLDDEVHD